MILPLLRIWVYPLNPTYKYCRDLDKSFMINNTYLPKMEVNLETYEVRADGELLTCDPAEVLPMTQRYFLF